MLLCYIVLRLLKLIKKMNSVGMTAMKLKKTILIICFLYLNNTLLAIFRFDQERQMWVSTNATQSINGYEYHRLAMVSFEACHRGAHESVVFTGLRANGSQEALLLIEDIHEFAKTLDQDRIRLQNPHAETSDFFIKIIACSSAFAFFGLIIFLLNQSKRNKPFNASEQLQLM